MRIAMFGGGKGYFTSGKVVLIRGFSVPFCDDSLVFNVSSTNSEQSKLCINSPLQIDAWLLWK